MGVLITLVLIFVCYRCTRKPSNQPAGGEPSSSLDRHRNGASMDGSAGPTSAVGLSARGAMGPSSMGGSTGGSSMSGGHI
ncbi:hypothetical protein F4677DRAFT_437297 [Hypoxylon crocopeplum]|nr:hypothetical protein F4677DRAFT_437297 [Hypoxylon crocopeplum]